MNKPGLTSGLSLELYVGAQGSILFEIQVIYVSKLRYLKATRTFIQSIKALKLSFTKEEYCHWFDTMETMQLVARLLRLQCLVPTIQSWTGRIAIVAWISQTLLIQIRFITRRQCPYHNTINDFVVKFFSSSEAGMMLYNDIQRFKRRFVCSTSL